VHIAKLWDGKNNILGKLANKFRAADNLFTLLGLDKVIEECVSALAVGDGINSFSELFCKLQSNLNKAGKKDHLDAESCALSMVCFMSLQAYNICTKFFSFLFLSFLLVCIAVEIRGTAL
jgi:hypothetical protein